MNRFGLFKRWAWSILVVSAMAFALGGCSGDDGQDGAAGPPGPKGDPGDPGDPGPGASIIPLESCEVCHSDGSYVSAPDAHELPPIESVSNISFAVVNGGADLAVTFDVAADDVPATSYDIAQRAYFNDGGTVGNLRDFATLTNNGGGNYTITVAGAGPEAATNKRWLFRVQDSAERESRTYFYADYPASPFAADVSPVIVSAESCEACHGPEGIPVHGSAFIASEGGEPCLTCHGAQDGYFGAVPPLFQVSHGYHAGIKTWRDPVVPSNITYPTYMNNCSVCHSEGAELTAANSMTVEADNCFSCHGSIAGIPFAPGSAAEIIHANVVDGCEACHAGQIGGIPQTVADAHNGAITGRGGVIWDGVDTSVTEGALFDWEITGVADDGTDLTITWQATYNGVGVDPCNDTPAAGAPAFHAIPPFTYAGDTEPTNRNNLSILRNYAQGEDFILGLRGGRVGQPNNDVDIDDTNTSCAGNVATTVVPVEVTVADDYADYGRVAIQGKPWVVAVDPDDEDGVMRVRAKTPTFDWVVGAGGPAPQRRAIADSGLCVECHVGSLYQHGGNRVDNIDMCMLCHNSAANDQYVRVDSYGVDPSEAYDGRAGQAFGIKEMVHAVHPAGAFGNPLVIYRGRGIYGWATDESQLPNWPGDGDDLPVFGSDDGTGNPVLQDHHFHSPTFPRALNDCAACHVQDDPLTEDTDETFVKIFPDPTKAMATTVEAGAQPFEDQLNDVLQGVQTTSCISCHADSATTAHGWQNSWVPQEFPEGRQTIIDAN